MRNVKRHILVPCLAGAALGLLAASAATAQTCYRLTDLGSPQGAGSSEAFGGK